MSSSNQVGRNCRILRLSPCLLFVVCAGCISNPLPSEFHSTPAQISAADLEVCQRIEGTFSYHGAFVQRATEGVKPTAAVYVLKRKIRDEWQPEMVRISIVNVEGNLFTLALAVLDDGRDPAPLAAITAEAWCIDGKVRIVEEQAGNSDGTPVASWSVRDLTLDELGYLNVEYTFSARSWMSGTDFGRAIVRFEPSPRE